jgi:hypothetical protein
MYNKSRKQFNNKPKNKRRRGRTRAVGGLQSLTVRQPGKIVPDKLVTTLSYIDVSHSSIGIPATVAGSFRYRPTAIYDVDPLIGGTTIPGFTELSALYNYYRVHSSTIKGYFVNQDATTAPLIIILPLNSDPGSGPTPTTLQSWEMNPYSKMYLMSSKGGYDRAIITNHMTTKKLVGSQSVKYDDTYASAVTTVPTNNWYWAVGALSEGGVNFTLGVTYQVKIDITVEFYDRKELLS